MYTSESYEVKVPKSWAKGTKKLRDQRVKTKKDSDRQKYPSKEILPPVKTPFQMLYGQKKHLNLNYKRQ